MTNKTTTTYLVLTAVLLFIIDRILKGWALRSLPSEGYLLFEGLGGFGFKFYANTGIAFSLPVGGWILGIILVAIFIFLLVELYRSYKQKASTVIYLAIALIMLGALSNVVDRLTHGYVIDFINIFLWPAFNIADVMIVAGVLMWVFVVWRKK